MNTVSCGNMPLITSLPDSHVNKEILTERKFNHADLRLFGPNATVGILGKICFDFSNNLQGRTIPEIEMTSILDWIGYSADIASLKTFFGQKGLTVLAAWEGLNSTIRQRRHLAAFKTIFSVHLSLGDQVPCTIGPSSRDIGHYLMESPEIALILINAYPCYTGHLDLSLQIAATTPGHPITSKLVQQLSGAGASFKNEHRPFIVDDFISRMGRRKCQTADLDLLKIFLEAGVVVDWQPELQRDWPGPNEPIHATDYLLLEGGYDTHNRGLWSLVSSYSDRQQTTVTVPGIFEAAQGGHDQLRFYLNDRTKPCGDHDRKQILEIALSEASERGYVKVLHNLMQFGVDPNVRMLPEFYRDISCTYKMTNTNEWYTYKKRNIWHPVVRAANAGKVDTLRMLVAVSSIDIALVNERVGAFMQLDLYALRDMENSQLDQILRLLLTLGLTTATRNDILLQALGPCRCHSHEHGADFEFVDQLLELGLASSDHRVHLDGEMHLLVCAIRRNCAIRSLNYLVERDMLVLSALSASTIEALCDAALRRPDSYSIMEFLSQKLEGFKAYVQKNSSLLLKSLQDNFCCEFHVNSGKDRDDNCSVMITAKWLLGLGATLDISGFSQLTQHASENFILAMIDSVPNIKELEKWSALRQATEDGRYNLAVALVERGAMQLEINDPQELHSETALQVACHKGAPLWFIKFLVDKGADVNAPPTADSGTALQNACGARASLSCVRFLLDQGADVNAPTAPDCEFYRGLTAIHLAVNNTSMNMVGLLLDHGADVNALSRFLRVGLNLRGIRAPLNFLRPIDLAAWRSHLDMVHFLIEAGGRSSYPGLTGFDGAIALATEYRHFAIAALLQKHADSHRGDRMEAERRWLQANANVRMYEGRIELQADDPLMEIDETESEDSEADSEAAAVDGL